MLKTIVAAAVLAVAVALAGCNPAEKLRDPAADAEIRAAFAELRAGDPKITGRLAPEAAATATPEMLAKIRALVPPGEPRKRTMVNTSVFTSPDGVMVTAVDDYDFGDKVVRLSSRLERRTRAEPWRISAFNVNMVTRAELKAVNGFWAPGKTAGHYAFLLATILSPLAMIAALIKVIRTRGLRRKWLWGILAFACVGTATMNWTTGQAGFNFVSVQLIGAGITRDLTGFLPWTLTFSVPMGALLILSGLWANPKRARKKAGDRPGDSAAAADAFGPDDGPSAAGHDDGGGSARGDGV